MVAGDFSDVLKTLKSPKQVPGMRIGVKADNFTKKMRQGRVFINMRV
jgi:hypothetical protein